MMVYVAGPMIGIPYFNFPAFDAASEELRLTGMQVINPADLDRDAGFDAMSLPPDTDWNKAPDGFDMRKCAARDMTALVKCDAIALLPGWSLSAGCRAELCTARWLKLDVYALRGTDSGWSLLDGSELEPSVSNVNGVLTAERGVQTDNPKDVVGSTKIPLFLWPRTASLAGSMALLEGALKYGRDNWRATPIRLGEYISALDRHEAAYIEGEYIDPPSGLPHTWKMLATLAIIIDADQAGTLIDDRKVKGRYHEMRDQWENDVQRLKHEHANKHPRHFTIKDTPLNSRIRAGDSLRIRPEWRDDGDDEITFTAVEDEDGGRVRIRAELGMSIDPQQVVTTDMVERA